MKRTIIAFAIAATLPMAANASIFGTGALPELQEIERQKWLAQQIETSSNPEINTPTTPKKTTTEQMVMPDGTIVNVVVDEYDEESSGHQNQCGADVVKCAYFDDLVPFSWVSDSDTETRKMRAQYRRALNKAREYDTLDFGTPEADLNSATLPSYSGYVSAALNGNWTLTSGYNAWFWIRKGDDFNGVYEQRGVQRQIVGDILGFQEGCRDPYNETTFREKISKPLKAMTHDAHLSGERQKLYQTAIGETALGYKWKKKSAANQNKFKEQQDRLYNFLTDEKAQRIVAAVEYNDDYGYIFFGDGTFATVKYDGTRTKLVNIRPINKYTWSGLDEYKYLIRAAHKSPGGDIYFYLSDGRYLKYNVHSDRVDYRYPKEINEENYGELAKYKFQITAAYNPYAVRLPGGAFVGEQDYYTNYFFTKSGKKLKFNWHNNEVEEVSERGEGLEYFDQKCVETVKKINS